MQKDEFDAADGGYGVRAVERVCDIILLLGAADDAVHLPDIARVSGLPKSTVFRYLSTLESRRFVERTGDGNGYRLGAGLLSLRNSRIDSLATRMEPVLRSLRDEFAETANLGYLDGREVAYLRIVESPKSVRLAARSTDRDELHCTALGKVLLADMADAEVVRLIGTSYSQRTANTKTNWSSLRADLADVRDKGYAVDDEENEEGGRCVAVQIPGTSAAVSISAPVDRMPHSLVPLVAARMTELIRAT